MKVREIALEVLDEVFNKGAYSNIALDKAIRKYPLSDVDRSFLTMIVHGTLQKHLLLDYQVQKVVNRPLKPLQRIIILMSLYQLRYMTKTPSYAIINEAVDIAKELDGQGGGNFVNGVLRKLAQTKFNITSEKFLNQVDYLSVKYNHPSFIVKMWISQYGEETTVNILKQNQLPASLCVRVDTNKIKRKDLLELGFEKGKKSPYALIYKGDKRISSLDEFINGLISVQDESGQLVVPLLDLKVNDRILDMCAAPGSKLTHMVEILKGKGNILACDIHEHRIKLLQQGLKRSNINHVEYILCDARKLSSQVKRQFNKILLDAPCSGLGVVRRKPDILLNVSPTQLDAIRLLQSDLLDQAYQLLEVGGTLVYSTCTLNKKENDMQISDFIKKYPNMRLVHQETIFPFTYNSDGFYMAKLVKE